MRKINIKDIPTYIDIICYKCGKAQPLSDYCIKCGKKLDQIYCPR